MRFAKEKPGASRRGYGLAEVVVVLAIVLVVTLLIVAALPRGRENARLVGCRENLRQIGMALQFYHRATDQLPTVPDLGPAQHPSEPSPLQAMLLDLGLADFHALRDPKTPPARQPNAPTGRRPISGFVCPSDPTFPLAVSYRACAGDAPAGVDGAFAPGKLMRARDIEAGDGLAFTAAFSERLVGTGRDMADPRNYALMPGPVGTDGCPQAPASAWRGDAGRSWVVADWGSTLYNHALPPGAPRSCLAEDGQTALMGASSGHADGVHVLLLDGSLRAIKPRVDLKIWRALANVNDQATAANEPARDPAR